MMFNTWQLKFLFRPVKVFSGIKQLLSAQLPGNNGFYVIFSRMVQIADAYDRKSKDAGRG